MDLIRRGGELLRELLRGPGDARNSATDIPQQRRFHHNSQHGSQGPGAGQPRFCRPDTAPQAPFDFRFGNGQGFNFDFCSSHFGSQSTTTQGQSQHNLVTASASPLVALVIGRSHHGTSYDRERIDEEQEQFNMLWQAVNAELGRREKQSAARLSQILPPPGLGYDTEAYVWGTRSAQLLSLMGYSYLEHNMVHHQAAPISEGEPGPKHDDHKSIGSIPSSPEPLQNFENLVGFDDVHNIDDVAAFDDNVSPSDDANGWLYI